MSDFLSTDQAATRLGCTQGWVRKLARRGGIPGAIKQGRDWWIPSETVKFMAKNKKKL